MSYTLTNIIPKAKEMVSSLFLLLVTWTHMVDSSVLFMALAVTWPIASKKEPLFLSHSLADMVMHSLEHTTFQP